MDTLFDGQFANLMKGDILNEDLNDDKIDEYTDLLMNEMIKKDILYEPLIDAKEKIEEVMNKQGVDPSFLKFNKNEEKINIDVNKQKIVKQYCLICELVDLIDMEEYADNRSIIKSKLEELYNEGGLPSELMGNDNFMQIFGGGTNDDEKFTEDLMKMMNGKNQECLIF